MTNVAILLVCSPVSYFVDDVRGRCADCGTDIVWRPHAPVEAVRVCLGCARVRVAAEDEAPDVRITDATRREAALFPGGTRHLPRN